MDAQKGCADFNFHIEGYAIIVTDESFKRARLGYSLTYLSFRKFKAEFDFKMV